ncbi:alpha/beta fold hydrolase [Cupriavidus sp. D39]|nr:alpha/beta fold hydrolase [Cupriavidus sp. D39]
MRPNSFSSWRTVLGMLGFTSLAIGVMAPSPAAAERVNNVVLVHGGFVDGGGWESVYKLLKAKGLNVSIVQNPTTSLAADVAATKAVVDAQDGPVVLVGHSYGGWSSRRPAMTPMSRAWSTLRRLPRTTANPFKN